MNFKSNVTSAEAEEYITKDSGRREEFSTGAVRDDGGQKTRYDLIPVGPLKRLADLYARGAQKYGEGNFERGMPFTRVYASLLRHIFAWALGDREEDHLAACVWNAMALMFYEDQIASGGLPDGLNDMPCKGKKS